MIGNPKNTKTSVFFSTRSLPYTTQCRGHCTAWEWEPCQSSRWLLKWEVLTPQTPACFSFWLNDSTAHTAHVPELLHSDSASWSLQEQNILKSAGVLTGTLNCLEAPEQLLWQEQATPLVSLELAEKGRYSTQCDYKCKVEGAFSTRAVDSLQAFRFV